MRTLPPPAAARGPEGAERPCRSPSGGGADGIHRIREAPLPEIDMSRVYDVVKVLAEGCYARVVLAHHRDAAATVVLKAVHSELTPVEDFFRECHYSYRLSPHPNVLDSYGVSFRCDDSYVFAQEHAPLGDLAARARPGGLPEAACKLVAAQLASALDFMHSKDLVHRDVRPENVLVFAPDLSKVKLCDFGSTRREGALVAKPRCDWPPLLPPEVHETMRNERYICRTSGDAWQLGVLLFLCAAGRPPWRAPDAVRDPDYAAFRLYRKRRTPKIPAAFAAFSPRALRMFGRILEHKPDKRAPVLEVRKYAKDAWFEAGAAAARERADSIAPRPRRRDGSRGSGDGADADGGAPRPVSDRVREWVLSCDAGAEHVEGV